jgi:hypothetical protein
LIFVPKPAVKAKPVSDDLMQIAQGEQVERYVVHYGQALVTNYYQFVLVTRDAHTGQPVIEERYDIAANANTFWESVKQPRPQGQGLNDLYLRFYRMAERQIAENTRRGIVCFISNYSWLDGLSHPGMRERYLEAFNVVAIDNLNGDKYKTGKTTPDGKPDPNIFSTEFNREGIQVGTAIATLVRKPQHEGAKTVQWFFRTLCRI